MAKAKKLPSGSWRVLVYAGLDEQGKRKYESFTAPTKKEAEFLASEFRFKQKKKINPGDMTLGEAIDAYIAKKDGVLSPSTIAGYKKIRRTRFQELMGVKLKSLTTEALEQAVAKEAREISRRGAPLSPKTIANSYMLLVSVLKDYNPELNTSIRLPQQQNTAALKELLPPEIIFRLVKDTEIELPVLLAMWLSFSMSEIRGLTRQSVSADGYITIREVIVDVDGQPMRKPVAKQMLRQRRLKIPDYIQSLIDRIPPEQSVLVSLSGHTIYMRWRRLLEAHGLPHMTFHDLRHLNASVMASLGIPDKYAQERGGWKTDKIMKSTYQHTLPAPRQEADAKIDVYFDQARNGGKGPRRLKIKKMQHEMQHKK